MKIGFKVNPKVKKLGVYSDFKIWFNKWNQILQQHKPSLLVAVNYHYTLLKLNMFFEAYLFNKFWFCSLKHMLFVKAFIILNSFDWKPLKTNKSLYMFNKSGIQEVICHLTFCGNLRVWKWKAFKLMHCFQLQAPNQMSFAFSHNMPTIFLPN